VYVFAIALLFALGVALVAHWLDDNVPAMHRFTMLAMAVLGVLGAWLADFDLWQLWDVPVRAEWIGIVLTGILLGGLAHGWHVLLGFVSGITRKANDEADVLEQTRTLKAA